MKNELSKQMKANNDPGAFLQLLLYYDRNKNKDNDGKKKGKDD